ncbi:MAG: dihydrofolate reductase [Planctomycetota bacterium]|nr:dihydrofolate reductase [Planctomycetota bacterium]
MKVNLIAAVSTNGVIGVENRLPWKLPGDLKRFKALTMGHPVVMGRKTWASIGRLLPGRENVILTRDPAFKLAGATICRSPEEALEKLQDAGEIFVIGGAEVYAQFLPRADRLYLTLVHANVEGDARFPAFDAAGYAETSRESVDGDPPYTFLTLERKG